jgi:predicted hydrocarbon binding protein
MKKYFFPLEREEDGARINLMLREETRKKHGNRVVLFGSGTFVELQKESESILGDEASAVFYESGIRAGREAAESVSIERDEKDSELYDVWNSLWGSNGVGLFKLVEYDYDESSKRGRLVVDDSFIATTYGRSDKAVCHFLSGFLAGIFEVLWKTPLICTEMKCWSKGDKYCEFILEQYL